MVPAIQLDLGGYTFPVVIVGTVRLQLESDKAVVNVLRSGRARLPGPASRRNVCTRLQHQLMNEVAIPAASTRESIRANGRTPGDDAWAIALQY